MPNLRPLYIMNKNNNKYLLYDEFLDYYTLCDQLAEDFLCAHETYF